MAVKTEFREEESYIDKKEEGIYQMVSAEAMQESHVSLD